MLKFSTCVLSSSCVPVHSALFFLASDSGHMHGFTFTNTYFILAMFTTVSYINYGRWLKSSALVISEMTTPLLANE